MENNNSYDWLAVSAQSQDKTFGDIYGMGVDPSNATLQSKDFYKKSNKIQEMFKTPEGGFDEKGFDKFYLNAEKSLNEYKKSDFDLGNVSTDLWEDSSLARSVGAPIRRNPVKLSLTTKDPFTNLKVAQGSLLGLTEINKWTKPTKTLSEVAQGRKVMDGITGAELGYTPEDTGLFNLFGFFNEPLVLAQHDKDGQDPTTGEKFKKGDYKFDKEGLPFYETLSGRDAANKQILSRWNTLSKESSYANKWDFMDSDGFDKSLTGLTVKTAVELAPFLFGGYVSSAYKAYYIAQGLIDGGAEIAKAIDGIVGGPEAKKGGLYKFLNNLQGYNAQMKGTLSDHGKENFMSLESLSSLAVDSVYQLMGQKSIAQWPTDVKKYQMAKELNLATKGVLNAGDEATKALFDFATYQAKYGDEVVKAAAAMSKNMDTLEKYAKYSRQISTAYMAATSAVGISQVAEDAGLDARDKGFVYLGYMASLIPLFKSDIGSWVEKGMDIDHLAAGINRSTRDYARGYLPALMAEAAADVGNNNTLKGKAISALAAGRKLGKYIANLYTNFEPNGMLGKAGAEALEEVTEQMLQDGVKAVYNGLSAAGIRSTSEQASFTFNLKDMAQDYLQNAVGGALGGAIFHKLDPHHENVFTSDSMKEYVTEGHGFKVIEKIKEMQEKGELGSTTLSAVPLTDEDGIVIPGMWKPVNEDNPISQNDMIADRMLKEIRVNEEQRRMYNIASPELTAEGKNAFYQTLVDTKTDTDLRDQIHDTARRIYELANEIQRVDNLDSETEEGMLEKKAELKNLQKRLEYLQSDESVDEYFRQGLFNIRTDINAAFGVKTRQSLTQELIGKNRKYTNLTEADKATVDNAYEEYRNTADEGGIKSDLYNARVEYERFDKAMEGSGYKELEVFKQSMLDLEKYTQLLEVKYPAENTNSFVYPELINNYVQQLGPIKYIPDVIYERVKSSLDRLSAEGANSYLGSLVNIDKFKEGSKKAIAGLERVKINPVINQYVQKVLGNEGFEELMLSEEMKDLLANKSSASNYSMLKVLHTIAMQDNPDTKTLEYRGFLDSTEALTNAEVKAMVANLANDASHPIADYLKKIGLDEFLAVLKEKPYRTSLDDLLDDVPAALMIKRFAKFKLLSAKSGQDISISDLYYYITEPGVENILIDLLTTGKYTTGTEVMTTDALKALPMEELDSAIDVAKNFDKERIASPLRKILEDTYEFADSQFQNLEMVGIENYINSDPEFVSALDAHINAAKKLEALITAAEELNPLINDFRKNHGAILPDDVKGIELFELSPQNASTLKSETDELVQRLQFLKDVNDYNRNNILAKLLKEDGLILASNVQTWKKLMENEELSKLLPNMTDLYAYDGAITTYAANVNLANDEMKFNALKNMAKFEHRMYNDFQKLSDEDKLRVVNFTFAPIDPTLEEFIEPINPDQELSDENRTIYLAKIFGNSSLDFAKDTSGEWNGEINDGKGGFTKIEAAVNTPFPIQENAVRLAYLLRNGDPLIKRWLFNAYTYADTEEKVVNFDVQGNTSMSTGDMMSVWGDPGTGKTTAVIAGFLATVDEGIADVVVLAPEKRQLGSLLSTLERAGYDERINKDHSNTVSEFVQKLGLKDRNGRAYDFRTNRSLLESIAEPAVTRSMSNSRINNTFFSSLQKAVSDIFDQLDIYDSKTATQAILKDNIAALLANIKLIVADEFTHINAVDLAVIVELANRYNNSTTVQNDPDKRITIVTAGDINQMVYTVNGKARSFLTYGTMIASTPLTTSLRSAWDLVNNPQIDIKRRTSKVKSADDINSTDLLSEVKQPIKLTYNISPQNGSVGIKEVRKEGATKVTDLTFITDNKSKLTGKDIVYVINDASKMSEAETLMATALGSDWKTFVDIHTPVELQGGEYKYAIVDATPDIGQSGYGLLRTFEFLNTMLSRATEATLLLNDGSLDKYVTLENVNKEKATVQTKLTDDMKRQIKDNRHNLMKAILEEYVPESVEEDVKEGESEPEQKPGTPVKEKKKAPAKTEPAPISIEPIPVFKVSDLAKIFGDKLYDTNSGTLKEIPGIKPTGETAERSPRATDVMAYTTYSTIGDFNQVEKVMYDLDGQIPKQDRIELVIASYKYYLLNRGELSESNLTLNSNFTDYFESLDYTNPVFYIEASKRGDSGMTTGRSLLNGKEQKPEEIILSLKVRIASKNGGKSLELTMGMLNNIQSIKDKHLKLKQTDGDFSDKIVKLMNSISTYVNGESEPPLLGQSKDGVWRSFDFDQNALDSMSDIFGSRITFKSGSVVDYNDFKQAYPDFYTSAPLVVVAANLDNDIGAQTANPYGTNPEYKTIWNRLKGKSIAFVSDVYALKSKTPQELLQIYFKQLDLFNNSEFMNLSPEQKAFRIEENTKNGIVIKLDKKVNTTNIIPYKPNMLKIVKLDNPKAGFLQFRQKFISQLQQARVNKNLDIKEGFKQFDMPVYVKDRLVKSLMTIYKFLQGSKENQKWFEENVLSKHLKNVDVRIDDARKMLGDLYGDPDIAATIDPDNVTGRAIALNSLHGVIPMTVTEFSDKLYQLLYNADNKLIRGIYQTDTNQTKKVNLTTDFKVKDLDFTLSKNKLNDFKGNILSINAFQLFLNTKNLNFTDLIDFSLKEFAALPIDGDMGKYSLKDVFTNGEIESVVVAANNSKNPNVDQTTNMLAEASQYGNGFTFNLDTLQTPAYNIDFNKLFRYFESSEKDDTNQRLAEVTSKLDLILKRYKGLEATDFYQDLQALGEQATTMEEIQAIEDAIPESVVPVRVSKGTMKPGSIVAYSITKEGIIEKLTVKKLVQDEFEDNGIDLKGAKFTVDQAKVDEVNMIVTTADAEYKVKYSAVGGISYTLLQSQEVDIDPNDFAKVESLFNDLIGGKALTDFTVKEQNALSNSPLISLLQERVDNPSEDVEARIAALKGEKLAEKPVQKVKKTDPMDTIRKIEKTELAKFDKFIEQQFGEALMKVDVIKQYVEMNREFFRHTVVDTNLAALPTAITLANYDTELANFSVDQFNAQTEQFENANRTQLNAARSAISKMVKLIKFYKAC